MSEPLYKRIKDWFVTITAFRSGDVIPVDGPSGTAKMSESSLKQVIKDFVFSSFANWVESLPVRTSAAFGDKTVVSNATNGSGSSYYVDGNDIEIQHPDDSSFVKIIHGTDLIRGRVDSSGNYVDHNSRAVTKFFIPVKKGDEVLVNYDGVHVSVSVAFALYGHDGQFVSLSEYRSVNTNGGGGNNLKIDSDGFIKIVYNKDGDSTPITTKVQLDYFDSSVAICRFGSSLFGNYALFKKISDITKSKSRLVLTRELLQQGNWTYDSTNKYRKGSSNKQVRCAFELPVERGDIIAVTDTSIVFVASVGDVNGDKVFGFTDKRNGVIVSVGGYLHLSVSNSSSTELTPDDVAGKIVIYPARENLEEIFVSDVACLRFGSFNADDTISNSSTRLCNYKPIPANKGDILVTNQPDVMITVREVDLVTQARVEGVSRYISTMNHGAGDYDCGYYVVKHDGVFLNIVVAPTPNATLSGNLSDYSSCLKLLRLSNKFKQFKKFDKITPKTSRKGRVINTSVRVGQDAAIVDGKLWLSYGESETEGEVIKVIDVDDGSLVKTISHDFGHNGISDYCEETDTILIAIPGDASIYLRPNASDITSSMVKADCIAIDIEDVINAAGSGICACFGENKQTIYICKGYELSTTTNVNKIYRIWLAMEDGEYTGEAELLDVYDGDISDIGAYVDFGYISELLSTQSCVYDGWLYLAYGTAGHNFLVVELDDKTKTWRPVGRIVYDYKKIDGTKVYLEPEFVVKRGNKLITGSREYTKGVDASIVEFDLA